MILIPALIGLALVDSTSIGTLIVPIWLLLAPDRPPARRMLSYLVAIAVFYFLLGVLLLTVAGAGLERFGGLAHSVPVLVAELLVGVALFAVSWRFDSKKRRERGEPDRTAAWRTRALERQSSAGGLAVLAVSAGVLEAFSMVPYLAAIGLLVASELPTAASIALLAGYSAVMIVPALLLTAGRSLLHSTIEPMLAKLDRLLSRYADSATGWALAIAGIVLARNAIGGLAHNEVIHRLLAR
ncbi:GAP family protein [Nocardia pseudobrasiliensis]|uniref:Sap-like sulfolipid-1-addressing protein n=1 Tax=Nocardia pseudobrasiliensis TaxID=45979 RepID=A0A370IA16_9NOCA|nr:GAP family protein [Nocardia pseudobrasiliensis]RDI67538.1 Sap-like sulfolipid-1-addressing protein [Nocardia pseudobrasiliensis]